MRKLYQFFLDIGQQSHYSSLENKKIKLLNIYVLITLHFVVIMPIGDTITGIITSKIILCYLVLLLFMIVILFLNKHQKYYLATTLWLAIVLFAVFMFSIALLPQSYSEYYYVFVPGIALTLFNKNTIPAIVTLFSLFLFFIPYYIIVVYPESVVNKLDPFAVFGLFTCVYLLVNYFKKINTDNEKELKETYKKLEETKKNELANLQLKLLRGRMNPHFMFNTMNSVQNLVIKGNTMDTYTYLSKFSAVIRENLRMSEKTYVFFEDEFSLLQKYLELEKLRFKNSLNYVLEKGNVVAHLKIPSMIIQPFIENSLHRMFHKTEGVKDIDIQFYQNNKFITCTIIDNGILVNEMFLNQQEVLKEQASFSVESMSQHLELLKEFYKINIGFEYTVKNNKTICSVKIPYETIK
ncbi:sensor histidine kinase YesM [Wenyingzhuangia heitensis]|uniref:Sensor histidine kinase YesM n=1 Tax=Wenyingzhuangia heitensis TaxID=1487859 RepID=A0ABX0UC98_9FLAO|nr:sensor histidine kinase [Wenyingzhuangia heitensis]NIJ44776.1 sensor histidine kinase YesM [Wenyingzhuangia heitensis]